jgi:hypothetical protein
MWVRRLHRSCRKYRTLAIPSPKLTVPRERPRGAGAAQQVHRPGRQCRDPPERGGHDAGAARAGAGGPAGKRWPPCAPTSRATSSASATTCSISQHGPRRWTTSWPCHSPDPDAATEARVPVAGFCTYSGCTPGRSSPPRPVRSWLDIVCNARVRRLIPRIVMVSYLWSSARYCRTQASIRV